MRESLRSISNSAVERMDRAHKKTRDQTIKDSSTFFEREAPNANIFLEFQDESGVTHEVPLVSDVVVDAKDFLEKSREAIIKTIEERYPDIDGATVLAAIRSQWTQNIPCLAVTFDSMGVEEEDGKALKEVQQTLFPPGAGGVTFCPPAETGGRKVTPQQQKITVSIKPDCVTMRVSSDVGVKHAGGQGTPDFTLGKEEHVFTVVAKDNDNNNVFAKKAAAVAATPYLFTSENDAEAAAQFDSSITGVKTNS